MELGKMTYDRETETETVMRTRRRAVRLPKAIEDQRQKLLGDTISGIANLDPHAVFEALVCDLYPSVVRCELHCIGEKIPDHLLQTMCVACDLLDVGFVTRLDRYLLRLGRRTHDFDGRFDRRNDIRRREVEVEIAGDQTRGVEQIVDELRLRTSIAIDRVERVSLFFISEVAGAEDLSPTEYRVERCAKLVRNSREKFVLQTARLLGLLTKRLFAHQQTLPLGLDPFPLHKLPDLATDRLEHLDEARIIEHRLAGMKLDDTVEFVRDLYRKADGVV